MKTNVFSLIENTIPFKNYIIKILSKQNSKEINFDNNLTTNPIFIQDDNDESINGVIFFYNGNPTDKNKKSLLTVDSNFVNFLKLGYSDFQVALSKNAVISLYDLTLYDQEISIDQYLLLEYSNKYKISELNKLDLNIDYFTYLFPDLVKRFDLLDKVNAKFKISKFYQNYNSDSLPAFDAILTLKLPNNFETNIEEEIKMEFKFEISSIKIGLNNTDKQKEYGIIFNPIYPKLISDIKIISKYNKIGLVYEFNLSIWLNKILKTIFLFSDLVNPLADNQKANIFLEERYPCLKINEMDDFFVFIPLNC